MEQSATRDPGLLLTFDHNHAFDIPEGDQVSPFSSVIRLTWRRLLRWSADVCIELCNSLNLDFRKVSPQLCDGSTLIHDICSSIIIPALPLYIDVRVTKNCSSSDSRNHSPVFADWQCNHSQNSAAFQRVTFYMASTMTRDKWDRTDRYMYTVSLTRKLELSVYN